MQKLTSCKQCGQQAYVETSSMVAQACPSCGSVLSVPNQEDFSPNPYSTDQHDFYPAASNPMPSKSMLNDGQDLIIAQNELANKRFLLVLAGFVAAVVLIVALGLVILFVQNPSEPSVAETKERSAETQKSTETIREPQDAVRESRSSSTPRRPPRSQQNPNPPARQLADINQPGLVRRFPNMGWGIDALVFSPDAKLLFGGKYELRVFNLEAGTKVFESERLELLGSITQLAIAQKSNLVLGGSYKGGIQVWRYDDRGKATEENRFVAHVKEITAIAISADDRLVLSGSAENKARLWDLETCKQIHEFSGFQRPVKATHISADQTIGLASDGVTLKKYDLQSGKLIESIPLGRGAPQDVAISPDGKLVISQDTYSVLLWDTDTGESLPKFEDREIQWCLGFGPRNQFVYSGGLDKVNQWNVNSRTKTDDFEIPSGYVKCIAISPDGKFLASAPNRSGQALSVYRLK